MKFSCTKENLFQGLATTAHISGRNVNLPILNNVHVCVDKRGIRLTTTNLEVAVVCTIRGKVDEEGEYTVPSKLLFDYINLLPNERIDLERNGEQLSVRCEKNQTTINGLSATEFPLVPPVVGDSVYELDAQEFRQALARVLFSVASSEARVELSGVSMVFNGDTGKGTLVLAATDSYRLAERVTVLDTSSQNEPVSVIVPARTLGEVSRILGVLRDDLDAEQKLQIRLSGTQIVFKNGPVELTSRTIDGSYPDYRQIIPTSFVTEANFRREDLIKAVKTASLFSKTGLFDVTLSMDSENGITVKSSDTTRGQNVARAEAIITGQPNMITVNYRYLLDGLNAMAGDDAVLGVNDAMSPCLVRQKDSKSYLYLVMPIKQ